MDQKRIKAFIKETMKKKGFKTTGDFFFQHINDNFIIIDFSIVKSLESYVEYKKYSYDDINWKMHNVEELSSKGDSHRVLGAHRIPALSFRKYSDEYTDEEDLLSVIASRIEQIVSVDLPAAGAADVNKIVLDGNSNNKLKCIALIDSGRIDEAVSLAAKCVENGEDGGECFWGQTFFELLINVYSGKASNEYHSVQKGRDVTAITPKSEIYDNIDWHYDDAKKAYSEKFGEYNLELVDINRIAGAHIVYFLTWLIMNDALEQTVRLELNDDIDNVKKRIASPTDILLEYFDGKLLRSDINPRYNRFADCYYETDYFKDYSNLLSCVNEDPYLSEFNWNRYNKIEPVITRRYNEFISK